MGEQMKDTAAFPSDFSLPENQGMTLRDYFAAAALPAILSDRVKVASWQSENGTEGEREISAMVAYEYADAMLAERGK